MDGSRRKATSPGRAVPRSPRGTAVTVAALAIAALPLSAPPPMARAAGSPGVYAAAVLPDHPRVFYRLQETTGTVAHDSSGHGSRGTYHPGATLGITGAITTESGDHAVRAPSGGPAITASGAGLPDVAGPIALSIAVHRPSG
jgi:hypothetical protein